MPLTVRSARKRRAPFLPLLVGVLYAGTTAAMAATRPPALAPVHGVARQAGGESIVYSFTGGVDGANPQGALIADGSGMLYGSARAGGSTTYGTVFRLTPSGSLSLLYTFIGGNDGIGPTGALIADGTGTLFGTTSGGGSLGGYGTVYKLTPSSGGYAESIAHAFQGPPKDGSFPFSGVVANASGTLFGTAEGGGPGESGIVYALDPQSNGKYKERVIYGFKGGADGGSPQESPLLDANGNLYGTTYAGGSTACGKSYGCGVIYKLTPKGRKYKEAVIHTFTGSDGYQPKSILIADAAGNLYGTAYAGGTSGCGNVFKLTAKGKKYTFSTLYNFSGPSDGCGPQSGVVADANGVLYGTTIYGPGGSSGSGTVYSLTPSGRRYKEQLLHAFTGSPDGQSPAAGLLLQSGALFGTAYVGGADANGAVYEVSPSGQVLPRFGRW